MASKKHGTKVAEWAKHLRPYGKRRFNKASRKDGKRRIRDEQ